MRAILTYHSIDPSGSPISVDDATLRRHVDWLASAPVSVVGLERLLDEPDEADAVALTFDDGFVNFAERAWPLLRDRGLPVTLFVATDHVGRTNRWPGGPQPGIPLLPLLDWEQLGSLAGEGVTIGSHSRSHRDLRTLAATELEDELEGAAGRIERRIGRRPETFAYPYGRLDDRVADAVRSRHRLACTTDLRALAAHDDACRLPRLDAYYFRAPGRLESFGSAGFRTRLWLRAAARRLRARLREPGNRS